MKQQERDSHTASRLWAEYARTHDPRTREALVHQFERLAHSIANRYLRRGEGDEDLFQVARIGLVKAVDRFDPSTNYRFTTFAAPAIMGEIKRHFRDHSRAVHVPRSLQELAPRVEQTGVELASSLGRPATPTEIAAALQVAESQVLECLALEGMLRPLTIDGPIESGTAGEGHSLLEDCLGAPDAAMEQSEARICVNQLLGCLSEPLQEVVRLRYLVGLSQREAAGRLGLTQMQVCRLEKRALEQLRSHFAVH